MKYLILFFFGVVLVSNAQTTVSIKNGKLTGTQNADHSIRIFKGIPFAAPPVGDLRWQAPQPVKNWNGIKNCTEFSASPIQNKPQPFLCWTEEFIAQPEPLSEDCLYLNIWTPAKKKSEKLPVFVWIYGGGLNSGSANCAIYDGEEMSKQGVVFVSINYRVGVMGFLAHPALTAESGYKASGNYGFLDQMEALKWIQKNIGTFGGDPKNVTIAGQSAGSFSVNALIASPLTKGLFHKAIAQSGGLLNNRFAKDLASSEKQGIDFMKRANVTSIADLRKISADDIQTLSQNRELGQFGVTLDNYYLPADLRAHFAKGLQNQIPILTGWVEGDGSLMGDTKMTVEEYKVDAQKKYGAMAASFLDIFPVGSDLEVKAMYKKYSMINFGGLPSHWLAVYNSKPTYLYYFDHVPVEKPNFPDFGAFHTSEVPFALHTLHKWNRNWRASDFKVQKTMSAYWINFIKTGNPNGTNLPAWHSYSQKDGNILLLQENTQEKSALFKKEIEFYEKLN